MKRKYLLPILLVLTLACAGGALKTAHEVGYYNQKLYDVVSDTWAREVVRIYPDRDASLENQKYFSQLQVMGNILTTYANVHNSYKESLDIWDATGVKPTNYDALAVQISELINQLVFLATQMGWSIPTI